MSTDERTTAADVVREMYELMRPVYDFGHIDETLLREFFISAYVLGADHVLRNKAGAEGLARMIKNIPSIWLETKRLSDLI